MSAAASKPLRPPARDDRATLPLAERLPDTLTAVEAFRRLADLPHVVFFDSATASSGLGRYSYVAADPFAWIESPHADEGWLGSSPRAPSAHPRALGAAKTPTPATPNGFSETLAAAEQLWQRYRAETVADLPPFQGGLAGLLGYELGSSLERVAPAAIDDLPTPPLALGAYDVVLAFDHHARESWIVSQGFPELEPLARRERAAQRIAQFREWLERGPATAAGAKEATPFELLAPQFDVGIAGVTSNFSADAYRALVRQAVEYIHAGDVFQVNLAQRLLTRATIPPVDLFLRLRAQNPAPYAGYFDIGGSQIVSASPECFLSVRGRQVETRPIKGTRARHGHALADLFAGDELRASEKDRAENVMIVDLMRNDLSRVCLADSVRVEQLCRLETYAFVQHLVSVVHGELRAGATPFDLIRASFPGGSITGAPKVRAMEIIAELEPTVRGPYCGSLGFVGFDGTADFSILIRTITASRGWLQFPAGGGIVAQSDPDDEYQETWHKARGLLRALR